MFRLTYTTWDYLRLILFIGDEPKCSPLFNFFINSFIFISLFYYFTGNETYDKSRDRITLQDNEQNIKNAILIIDSATMDDRGDIICNVENIEGKEKSSATYVRVKGK